jgi:ABC-type bacteriocin/lantibiotic exporter with double-glycine peptidase domain
MIRRRRARSGDLSEEKSVLPKLFCIGEALGPVLRLVGSRQYLGFLWLIAARAMVGFCDLLLAAAMYLLFLLLQGVPSTHSHWWMPRTTLAAALLTAALVILRALMDLASTRSVVGHIQTLYTEILLRLTDGYNRMQWVHFAQRNRSELLNQTMYTAREAVNFYHLGVEITAAAGVVMVMTVALVCQNPFAACGLGAAVAVFYGAHRLLIRKNLQRSASEREQSVRTLQRCLADMLSSGREIRSYGIETFFRDRIASQARSAADSHQRVALLPQLARIFADQGVVLLFLCVVIAAVSRHEDSRKLLSLLVFYFVLSRRLLPLISQISFMAGQMESSYKSVQIIGNELRDCLLYRTTASVLQAPSGSSILEVDQVSLSFHEGTPILQNVTFCLRGGEMAVLRGVSGSGKSSLLNLIAGVLQATTGVVHVDRASVAYVPQDITLLDDSIRNNLLFGLAAGSDAELMHALTIANMREFVAAQPRGLDAAVGDNGVLLSGGQRQRLGVARAVFRGASLLLLDEATSALDEENESRVLENLKASGVAVLLVTHRAHQYASVQRIFRLDQGYLIEERNREQTSTEEEAEAAGLAC